MIFSTANETKNSKTCRPCWTTHLSSRTKSASLKFKSLSSSGESMLQNFVRFEIVQLINSFKIFHYFSVSPSQQGLVQNQLISCCPVVFDWLLIMPIMVPSPKQKCNQIELSFFSQLEYFDIFSNFWFDVLSLFCGGFGAQLCLLQRHFCDYWHNDW